jgi:hypothetical protein
MTREQQVNFWQAMGERTKARVGVNIPLDQSHFDWQQNKRMIKRFLVVVRRLIRKWAKGSVRGALLTCLGLIEESMLTVDFSVTIQGTDLSFPYGKGILSGWRWTALIDTVMNWGELHCALKILKRENIQFPLLSLNAQGDDDQVTTDTKARAIALALVYGLMNFEVNPGKFFIGEERDEYLRQVGEAGLVAGYPARAMNAILWRNPVSRDPPAGINRAREMLHSWNVLLSRGSSYERVDYFMRMDLSNGNGWTAAEVDAVLRTPVAYGGLGWDQTEGDWMAFVPSVVDKKYSLVNKSFIGIQPARRQLQSLGLSITEAEALDWAKALFDVQGVRTEIIGGETRPIKQERPYHRKFAYGGGVPTKASYDSQVVTSFGDYPIQVAVRRKDWEWLRSVAIKPEQRALSREIERRGGRRVWVDWLLGKLPFSTPEVPYWANDVVGFDLNKYQKSALSWLLTRPSFSMASVRRAAYTAERQVRLFLQGRAVRLGG